MYAKQLMYKNNIFMLSFLINLNWYCSTRELKLIEFQIIIKIGGMNLTNLGKRNITFRLTHFLRTQNLTASECQSPRTWKYSDMPCLLLFPHAIDKWCNTNGCKISSTHYTDTYYHKYMLHISIGMLPL